MSGLRAMRVSAAAIAAMGVLLAVGGAWLVAATDAGDAEGPSRDVHKSSEALLRSVLDTTAAFLAEDPVAARAALDRVKDNTPPLHPDDDAAYGSEIVNLDRAFHVTIDLSREFVTKRRMAEGFDQFVWVQRACVKCHGMAREAGWIRSSGSATESGE